MPAGTTLREFARNSEADLSELRGLNPDIQPNKVLPAGTLIHIDSVIDPANVLQDADGKSIREIAHGNSAKADELFEANRFVLGSIHFNGEDVLESTSLYYPPRQTEWMKDHDVVPQDVTQLVKDTFLVEKPHSPQTK